VLDEEGADMVDGEDRGSMGCLGERKKIWPDYRGRGTWLVVSGFVGRLVMERNGWDGELGAVLWPTEKGRGATCVLEAMRRRMKESLGARRERVGGGWRGRAAC
jgi:hypothetical protein